MGGWGGGGERGAGTAFPNVCPCALGTRVRASSPAQQPGPGSAWLTMTLLRVGDHSGSLPLRIPSHGTGLLPDRTWTSWLWEAARGWGAQQLPAGAWETGKAPNAHLQLRADPGCMECTGVWESCLCRDIGQDAPPAPFPAHPGWLGAAGQVPEVPLHPGNTQASHGRRFSIGLFQAGTNSLLAVQLPPPRRPAEGQRWIWDAQENPPSFQPLLHSLPSAVGRPSSALLPPWNARGMQSHSSPAGQGLESARPGPEHPWGHPRRGSRDCVVPTAQWDTQGCWRHPPALPVSRSPSPTGRRHGHLCPSSPPPILAPT